jgi:FkbM family methyltransferase
MNILYKIGKRFLLFIIRLFPCSGIKFHGQFLQDKAAYLFFKKKRTGFYVDIGAHDGVLFNNTYIFEQLGWEGICIEPQPDVFLKLKRNRKCYLYNAAVSAKSSDGADFVKVHGPDMLSGLSAEMSDVHRKRIEHEKGRIEQIKVKALAFDDIMSGASPGTNNIDLMSLDVEGGEMDILKTIDFTKYKFSLMVIENGESDNLLSKYMKGNGYKVLFHLGCDTFFVPYA